jgi:hypothetical protein
MEATIDPLVAHQYKSMDAMLVNENLLFFFHTF